MRDLSPESAGTGHCSLPDGGCVSILREHVEAIRLIDRIRESVNATERVPVRHWLQAADKVSADFFASVEHPRLGWYGMLADISGHGLVASMFAMHVPMLFRELVLRGMSLPSVCERIDRFLAQQNVPGNYFVCAAMVRVCGREVEVINAGMPDALLLDAGGRQRIAFPSRQLPLGIVGIENRDAPEVQRYRLALGESATLMLYTDGLSELNVLTDDLFAGASCHDAPGGSMDCLYDSLVDRIGRSLSKAHDDISLALISVPLPSPVHQDASTAIQVEAAAGSPLDLSLIQHITEHIDLGLVLTDAEMRIQYVNPAFSRVTGYSFAESLGQTPRMLRSGRHDHQFYQDMWRQLHDTGHWSGEVWNRRKDSTLYLEWLDIQVFYDLAGRVTHYLGSFTNIMEKRGREERMQFLAMHDPLTCLPNRMLLTDRGLHAIHRADRSERSLAVLFIDIDRFNTINDSLGHDIGDEVLIAVAHRMIGVLREDDTLARFGGDQFVCLLPDIAQREDALLVADKLQASLAGPVIVAGHQFKVSVSIGISAYPSDSLSFDDLIVEASRAMLHAKRAGGNLARHFTATMAVTYSRQLETEARLDAALANGELLLFYQPKVDLSERQIIGVEALVRWHDPKHGMVLPGDFIPVAERSDLIARIGQWVLREVCLMLVRHEACLPADFHVAVNVSPKQFDRGDLAEEVASAIAETGVSPDRLQLEVTESLIIHDPEHVAATLQRVAEMGVSIALDDFGTGYSNLAALARLPIDTFKLDQSFVRNVDTDAVNASIALSTWHLAEGLGKKVVAEGIETCDECCKLLDMGYQIGQGHRFGRPMSEADLMDRMAHWDPDAYKCSTKCTMRSN